nr:expressed protein [Hymenolepis microstoma]
MKAQSLIILLLIISGIVALHRDCKDPIETGRGRASFRRYAYDQSTQKCREFIWGGCDANRNNFETLEECQLKCEHGKSHCAII